MIALRCTIANSHVDNSFTSMLPRPTDPHRLPLPPEDPPLVLLTFGQRSRAVLRGGEAPRALAAGSPSDWCHVADAPIEAVQAGGAARPAGPIAAVQAAKGRRAGEAAVALRLHDLLAHCPVGAEEGGGVVTHGGRHAAVRATEERGREGRGGGDEGRGMRGGGGRKETNEQRKEGKGATMDDVDMRRRNWGCMNVSRGREIMETTQLASATHTRQDPRFALQLQLNARIPHHRHPSTQ